MSHASDSISRRRLLGAALAAPALSGIPPVVAAQASPQEGRDFRRLGKPVPTSDPKRIEVVEFFWYGCPHCNSFEPELDAWAARLPADVFLRKVPARFNASMEAQQRLYYTLEAMDLVKPLHGRVFAAIHVQRQMLNTPEQILAWVGKQQGVDAARFKQVFESFGVRTKATQAAQLADAYGLEGVPVLYIDGRFMTAPSMVGTRDGALRVTDWLVEQARSSRPRA
jgi:thiol:disulfide interchange protein DsbA